MINENVQEVVMEFLNEENQPKYNKDILIGILNYQNVIQKDIVDWGRDEIVSYFKSIHSNSMMTLHPRYTYIRQLQIFESNKYGKPVRKYKITTDDIYDSIDKESVVKDIITPQDFGQVTKLIYQYKNSNLGVRVRERVILQLGWLGLSNNTIKFLKKDDVLIDKENQIVKISVDKNQIVSHDNNLIEDIDSLIKSDDFILYDTNNVPKRFYYKHSDYVIRPGKVGAGAKSNKGFVSYPNTSLQNALRDFNEVVRNPLLDKCYLENLRRSRFIYELYASHDDYVFVSDLYGIKVNDMMRWYRKLAKLKYGNEDK